MEVHEVIGLETTPARPSSRTTACFQRDLRRATMASSKIGESSNPVQTITRVCEICAEEKRRSEWFRIEGCSHEYCKDCTSSYVAAKLQENVTAIGCPAPGCRTGKLSPENCREILSLEVFERWGFALCEAMILASKKFVYCPYRDCSAMLIDDGKESVTQTCCPDCYRMFCAQCGVKWHTGIECEEFRDGEREKEDEMLRRLAKKEKWMRCPNCSFYVEKVSGCLHITCRCGSEFCYNCGGVYKDSRCCNNCNR